MPVELTLVQTLTELETTVVEVILESASEPGPQGPPGAAGSTTLDGLTDVTLTSPQDGDRLQFDSGEWVNTASAAVGPHGTSHENGGTDEISVAGLSGLLADAQTPLSHAHAGEDITSGTVADARIASTIARDSEVSSAISTSEAGQVRDGDTAGGVLGGTYPNPSFAADMATQAELDAHAADTTSVHGIADTSALALTANAVMDGDTAGGVLGGTYPNPSFAADMATQAELDAHISDSSAAHAASAISVDSTTLVGTGTDVQAVFEELDNGISDHLADSSAAHAASAISFSPAGTIAATDVQAAIEEVATEAGGGGAPTTADYLVGTTQGGLSAEIVVGTSPGGELGGTWASPTVDATHSGSSHAGVQAAAEATAASALATHEADTTSVHGITDTSTLYRSGGTDVALADGGTGASLSDPNADRILFWDDSAGAVTWLTAGTNLTITNTTIDASGGSGTADFARTFMLMGA